jgi:hypothetical protein
MIFSSSQLVSWKQAGALLGCVLLGTLGWYLSDLSFEQIYEMRQLERVPSTSISSIIEGEVNLQGTARKGDRLISAPRSDEKCIYYRYTVEEKRDDDWVTIENETDFVPFVLQQGDASIDVSPGGATFHISESFSETVGDRHYTEYRIHPGDELFTFAYADYIEGQWELGYHREGSYRPLITDSSGFETRQWDLLASGGWFTAGFGAIALAVVCLLIVFRRHASWMYLTLLGTVLVPVLLYQGTLMLHQDFEDTNKHTEKVLENGKEAISRIFEQRDKSWTGEWSDLGQVNEKKYPDLTPQARKRIQDIRLNVARAVRRANANLDRLPDHLFASYWGFSKHAEIPLPEKEQKRLKKLESEFEPAKLSMLSMLMGTGLGGLLVLLGLGLGLSKLKVKRLIENIPTEKTKGVAYGLSEIKGTVQKDNEEDCPVGPVSGEEAVYYRYIEKEMTDDGWSEVKNKTRSDSFYCEDELGKIRVSPSTAEVTPTDSIEEIDGGWKYEEYYIRPGDDVYVLGQAAIDSRGGGDKLYMTNDEAGELPFLVSGIPEADLKLQKGQTGFFLLAVGLTGAIALALAFLGRLGTFGPALYPTLSGVSIGFLVLVLAMIYYNDFVFLDNEVERDWSNIDVELKRRYDLIERLEKVVRDYAEHEQTLQEKITKLRDTTSGSDELSPAQGEQADQVATEIRSEVSATVEDYPDLKADEMVSDLMDELTNTEDRIELMRAGFNKSVERYNNRLRTFPEVFIANAFGFKGASFFRPTVDDEASSP